MEYTSLFTSLAAALRGSKLISYCTAKYKEGFQVENACVYN